MEKFAVVSSFVCIMFVLCLTMLTGCTGTRMDNSGVFGAKFTKTGWTGKHDRVPLNAFSHKNYAGVKLDRNKALYLVNRYRESKGLSKVSLDSRLNKAALVHAKDIAKHDVISHNGSDGSEADDRISAAGYKWSLAAENVATGQSSLEETFRGWQNSPGHNANLLLSDAVHVGFAMVYDKRKGYKTFWVMTIAKPI